jgi:hypothetical protein
MLEEILPQKFFYHYIPPVSGSEFSNQQPLNPTEIKSELPTGDSASQKFKVIGIIDSSGSMANVWKFLAKNWNQLVDDIGEDHFYTLTFDNKIRHNKKSAKLNDMLYFHGGGGTTIDSGFKYFEENILPEIPTDHEIKIIFISDGQDNKIDTLQTRLAGLNGSLASLRKDISFMCLGVLSEFPTFISMQLRQIYHNEDQSVPSIFLIEYPSEKAFFNKFHLLKDHLKVKQPIPIDPPQCFFPWEGLSETAKEGQWIFSRDKVIDLILANGQKFALKYRSKNFTVEAVSDIIRSWVQKLQLDCLNKVLTNELTIEYAKSTKNLVDAIIQDIREHIGLDLLKCQSDFQSSFYKKVLNQQVGHTKVKIEGYINDLNQLIVGVTPQGMSEFDAAKMIGLGTVVGKYHQKALALKNIGKDKFKEFKDEFINMRRRAMGNLLEIQEKLAGGSDQNLR